MPSVPHYKVSGFPDDLSPDDQAAARRRFMDATDELVRMTGSRNFSISVQVGAGGPLQSQEGAPVPHHPGLASAPPRYTWDQLVLDSETTRALVDALDWIHVQALVYERWGFSAVDPYPRTALNFHGPPGTGKTIAAHCAADRLERPLICASYAELESKFHGEGPKNVEALFSYAEAEDAVVFIDEADSLLSRRLTEANTGSEQAINSMRSQLLICLERFSGVVIFATNLVENYDNAFHGRVRHVGFPLPELEQRRRLWAAHLPTSLPTAAISLDRLAETEGVSGRDIKNAALEASQAVALRVFREDLELSAARITTEDLEAALERIIGRRVEPASGDPR
jgi:SpoVK/Ycf46/Vps4 family AAA+-type ATPase